SYPLPRRWPRARPLFRHRIPARPSLRDEQKDHPAGAMTQLTSAQWRAAQTPLCPAPTLGTQTALAGRPSMNLILGLTIHILAGRGGIALAARLLSSARREREWAQWARQHSAVTASTPSHRREPRPGLTRPATAPAGPASRYPLEPHPAPPRPIRPRCSGLLPTEVGAARPYSCPVPPA